MTTLSGYYQLPDDAPAAGTTLEEVQLIDYSTGQLLVASGTGEALTSDVARVGNSSVNASAVVINNSSASTIPTRDQSPPASAVSESLLGVPKSEVKLGLFTSVNSYGINPQFWASSAGYTYNRDPGSWTFQGAYGYGTSLVQSESALRAFVYPVPVSFTYPFDDGTGRYPGGYTDGVQSALWQTKQTFRYQPGRATGVTMGVKMSTNSQHTGEVIQWGVKNNVGDGYYFQLERGTDLYVVRTSPQLGTLKVERGDWNGDPVTVTSPANWSLDLSKVTMFAIEFSWYGAVGARFLAYVPSSYRDARWVLLHSITASDEYIYPSLRSPFLSAFTSVTSTAGTTQPAFIDLYGSSVYIDGGDRGTVNVGSTALDAPKQIDSIERSILGLQVRPSINEVPNNQSVYPTSLGVRSDVDAVVSVNFGSTVFGDINYTPGFGNSLSRGSSSSIPVTRVNDNTISGVFPDISAELSGTLNYLTGQRVKVNGTAIYVTHASGVSPDGREIYTQSRDPLPLTTSAVTLSRFNAWALSSGTIPSTVSSGQLYYRSQSGYWRVGLAALASGTEYDGTQPVVWAASRYPVLSYNLDGTTAGESAAPFGSNYTSSFRVVTGPDSTIYAGSQSVTLSGVSDPYPLRVIVQLQDNSSLSDVVYSTVPAADLQTEGYGETVAVQNWFASGIAVSDVAAGGDTYRASKFILDSTTPLAAALSDKEGYRVLESPEKVSTYFVGSGESLNFDLSPIFGPDRRFISGIPGSPFNTGAVFVTAKARTASGYINATLNWEEQQ